MVQSIYILDRTLVTVTARGSNGVIKITAYDAATRDKVNIVETGHTTSGGFSTTVQIKQKACMDREVNVHYHQLWLTKERQMSRILWFEAERLNILKHDTLLQQKLYTEQKVFEETIMLWTLWLFCWKTSNCGVHLF